MTIQEILFLIILFLILSLISLFGARRMSVKLKIIIFIMSCIVYTPLLLASIFVIGLSGIDASCRFLDMNCLKFKPEDLNFEIWMIIANISFIAIIILNFISLIIKFFQNKSKDNL